MQNDALQDGTSPYQAPLGAVAREYEQYFPFKLHRLLITMEANGLDHVASFQPHGRSFKVHDIKEFEADILPKWFQQTKYASFIRQLNLYGFKRISKGLDRGGYYHALFVRVQPSLCQNLRRTCGKDQPWGPKGSHDEEPNFYAHPPLVRAIDLCPVQDLDSKDPVVASTKDRAGATEPTRDSTASSRRIHPDANANVDVAIQKVNTRLVAPPTLELAPTLWPSSTSLGMFRPRPNLSDNDALAFPSRQFDPVTAALVNLLICPATATATAPANTATPFDRRFVLPTPAMVPGLWDPFVVPRGAPTTAAAVPLQTDLLLRLLFLLRRHTAQLEWELAFVRTVRAMVGVQVPPTAFVPLGTGYALLHSTEDEEEEVPGQPNRQL